MSAKRQKSLILLVSMIVFSATFISAASQNVGNNVEIKPDEQDSPRDIQVEEDEPLQEESQTTQSQNIRRVSETRSPPQPVDTVPPDAVIHWDSESKGIIVSGIDNIDIDVDVSSNILSDKPHKQTILYTLTDDANNVLNLKIELKCRDENAEVRILDMHYNGQHKTPVDNFYKVNFKTDKRGELVHVHQNIHLFDIFKLNTHFNARTDETDSELHVTRGNRRYENTFGGLYVFDLVTDAGDLRLFGNAPVPDGIIENPLINDVIIDWNALIENQPQGHHSYVAPGFQDTSEYMMGTVVVSVILMESNGNQENWAAGERTNVRNEIQATMNWWVNRFNAQGYNLPASANLNFIYDWTNLNTPIATVNEPITMLGITSGPNTGHALWITEANTALGYTTNTNYEDNTRQYLNDLRTNRNADWAFAIFVIDSSNDANGRFSDLSCAYAWPGGPMMVMTYDNDNYNWWNMDAVGAHETGHIFYALDEYVGSSSATATSGYLNIVNSNHATGGTINVNCIMKGVQNSVVPPFTNNQVCVPTREMVGWRDGDNDNIPDILDTFPSTTITAYSPDPTYNPTPTYTGLADVNPLTNNNPQDAGNDITLNIIQDVEYRIDGGTWISLRNTIGGWNLHTKPFTFKLPRLSVGQHTIDWRAVNSVGNIDQTPASDTLTVGLSYYPDIRFTNNPNMQYQPNVAVSGNNVHVVWSDERHGPGAINEIYYKRSWSGGATWSPEVRLTNNPSKKYVPDIAAFGLNIHIVWQDRRHGNNDIYYKCSTDNGISWSSDTRLSTLNTASSFNPAIVVNGNNIHVAFSDNRNGLQNYEIYYMKSTDGGSTWSSEIRLTTNTIMDNVPAIALSGNNIHIAWERTQMWMGYRTREISYMKSTDNGATWSAEVQLTPTDIPRSVEPRIAVSGSNIHVLWSDARDGNFEIYYKKSTDNGNTWGTDNRLSFDPDTSWGHDIGVNGNDIHVAYYTWQAGHTSTNLKYKNSKDNGVTWIPSVTLVNYYPFNVAPKIDVSGSDIHMVWVDIRDGPTFPWNREIYYKHIES